MFESVNTIKPYTKAKSAYHEVVGPVMHGLGKLQEAVSALRLTLLQGLQELQRPLLKLRHNFCDSMWHLL